MKKNLKSKSKSKSTLYYINWRGIIIEGINKKLRGDYSGLSGNCSGLRGDCTNLCGDCTGLKGDCTLISGDCTGIYGNLDECEIEKSERIVGINIKDLV